jgi:hypothetical protein
MTNNFVENLVHLNLAERPSLDELRVYPIANEALQVDFSAGTGKNNAQAVNDGLNAVQDVVRLDGVEGLASADGFKAVMTNGSGSLQALVNSLSSIRESIDNYAGIIDRVMGNHGGLRNFIPSALFESPQHLVASITGDVSLAGLFRAQAIAQGMYPAQPLPERAKNLRKQFEIEPAGFR